MKHPLPSVQPFSLDTDTATLLHSLAARLRAEALALSGLAYEDSAPGEPQFETIAEIARSLERAASLLEGVSAGLCEVCRMGNVEERVTLARPVPYRRTSRPPRASDSAPAMASLSWPPRLRARRLPVPPQTAGDDLVHVAPVYHGEDPDLLPRRLEHDPPIADAEFPVAFQRSPERFPAPRRTPAEPVCDRAGEHGALARVNTRQVLVAHRRVIPETHRPVHRACRPQTSSCERDFERTKVLARRSAILASAISSWISIASRMSSRAFRERDTSSRLASLLSVSNSGLSSTTFTRGCFVATEPVYQK